MMKPDFEGVKQYILSRLRTELSPRLSYHNIHHTKDYVVPACEQLAHHEQISDDDTLILLTAAYYHDIGYIKQYKKNEPISVQIASETLPSFGYNTEQIEIIGKIIMATTLPQSPQTHLAELLCDADLFHFGHDSFLTLTVNLWHELLSHGFDISEQKWYEDTLVFLKTHKYFTESARKLYNKKKEENIEKVQRIIEKIKAQT